MRNVWLHLMVVLSVFSVQGCWAGETKSEISKDEKSIKSDSTDSAATQENDNPELKHGESNEVKAHAGGGHYKLVEKNDWLSGRKHEPLCNEMLKNFNSFQEEFPMVCERKYNPELGFVTPNWQPIKTENIDWEMLRQIYFSKNRKRFSEEGLKKTWPEEKARLEDLADKQTILWHAEFDIDNKEGKERVFRIYNNICDETRGPYQTQVSPTMFVVDQKGSPDLRYKRLFAKGADTFIYKGHTYLSSWWGNPIIKDARLNIDDTFIPQNIFGISNKPICSYQYIQ